MKLNILKNHYKLTGIYRIRNIVNDKIYIGSTSSSFYIRFHEHVFDLKNNKHYNDYLQKSFNKHGEVNFVFEILEICKPDKCIKREQYYLDLYKSYNRKIGYNILSLAGNSLGYKHTSESIEKMKSFGKTRKINQKAIDSMKKANTGKKKSQHVKNCIKEAISIPVIQLSMEGNFIKEWKSATEAATYLNVSNNISKCTKNGRSVGGFLWVKKSEYDINKKYEYKGKQGIPNRKKLYQYDLNWNLIKEWDCISHAAKFLNIHDMSIHQCLRNEEKRTCKGFKWSKKLKLK